MSTKENLTVNASLKNEILNFINNESNHEFGSVHLFDIHNQFGNKEVNDILIQLQEEGLIVQKNELSLFAPNNKVSIETQKLANSLLNFIKENEGVHVTEIYIKAMKVEHGMTTISKALSAIKYLKECGLVKSTEFYFRTK